MRSRLQPVLVPAAAGFQEEVRALVRRFVKQIWNPQKREFLKRKDENWAHTLLFYLAFFAFVSAYAAMAFALYLEVYIDKNHPRTQVRIY